MMCDTATKEYISTLGKIDGKNEGSVFNSNSVTKSSAPNGHICRNDDGPTNVYNTDYMVSISNITCNNTPGWSTYLNDEGRQRINKHTESAASSNDTTCENILEAPKNEK